MKRKNYLSILLALTLLLSLTLCAGAEAFADGAAATPKDQLKLIASNQPENLDGQQRCCQSG